ncbi:aldehyde dehydrogenase family protein [Nocardioides speluncae]|uniref:aldehyde dehydrogenase family protein n=1 Tax=Nocardioides speluncae TaxID=2670337 RepID=UPI000D68E6AE|nr:aldehyde dehydrogenase family protein [Nocardioides speluncae]
MTDLVAVDALGPHGGYRTRRREVIDDVAGVPVAELSIVPPLFVDQAVKEQRRTRPLPEQQRLGMLAETATTFTGEVVGGLTFEEYVGLASRVSGLPVAVTRAGALAVAEALVTTGVAIDAAVPAGALLDRREQPAGTGGAVWARRGEVLGVHASGNAPGIHGLWLQALALGFRVAVRPSRREPFTGHRLILALRERFRPADAVYLPTDYAGADELVATADLSMVYGGQAVVDKYAGDPTVLVNGPGRTKILITADQDWRDYLDVIVDSVAAFGGTACVNATAILYQGDPRPLAEALAARLSEIPVLPITDERALLPMLPINRATAIAEHVAALAAGSVPIRGADQIVADLGDGSAALRPAVHLLDRPDAAALGAEQGFPCVWVAPWSRADGLSALRHTLVLGVLTADEDLVDDLAAEPTVRNVYWGRLPTHHAAPEVPHDGFLADFLMWNKGFARAR